MDDENKIYYFKCEACTWRTCRMSATSCEITMPWYCPFTYVPGWSGRLHEELVWLNPRGADWKRVGKDD